MREYASHVKQWGFFIIAVILYFELLDRSHCKRGPCMPRVYSVHEFYTWFCYFFRKRESWREGKRRDKNLSGFCWMRTRTKRCQTKIERNNRDSRPRSTRFLDYFLVLLCISRRREGKKRKPYFRSVVKASVHLK